MISGYVAFLDVLGFSNLVSGDSSNEKIPSYLECVKRSIAGSAVQYVVFSDSIMLTSEGSSDHSFLEIVGASSVLFGSLLEREIALRGAISFGSFWRSAIETSVFVAGRAIVEAYQFEGMQDWVGIMVAPSARAQIKDLKKLCELTDSMTDVEPFKKVEPRIRWAAYIQKCNIPFHPTNAFESTSFDGFAVVPTTGNIDPTVLKDSLAKSIERLDWLRSISPNPGVQQKYARTRQWLDPIQRLWESVAYWRETRESEKRTG